jgi:hypothetical protein
MSDIRRAITRRTSSTAAEYVGSVVQLGRRGGTGVFGETAYVDSGLGQWVPDSAQSEFPRGSGLARPNAVFFEPRQCLFTDTISDLVWPSAESTSSIVKPAFVGSISDPGTWQILTSVQQATWLDSVLTDFSALLSEAIRSRQAVPTEPAVAAARDIARYCAAFDLHEPTIELDDNGNIEFFVRTRLHGILFVLKQEGLLQVFGSSAGESWRARYELSGRAWRAHLLTFIAPLARE